MDAPQPSDTGVPLDTRSRLGEGQDDEAFFKTYSATALQPLRIAELQGGRGLLPSRRAPKTRYLGKRKQRRRENSNLGSLAEDLEDGENRGPAEDSETKKATFPVPPPPSFARKAPPAAARKPTPDPKSAQMGRYLLSMKGIQRRLRTVLKTDSRNAALVRLVEKEIIDWIYQVQVWEPHGLDQPARVIDDQLPRTEEAPEPAILEVERSTAHLKWYIQEPFLRFLVHLVARLWDVNSYSRTEADGRRLTKLVRPNLVHGDPERARGAPGAMATPNTTEWEASSMTGSMLHSTDSEDFSDAFAATDDGSGPEPPFSPWQTVRHSTEAEGISSSEDEGPGDRTFTAAGAPLRRVVSISSSDRSEFGDDEETGLAESNGHVRVADAEASR